MTEPTAQSGDPAQAFRVKLVTWRNRWRLAALRSFTVRRLPPAVAIAALTLTAIDLLLVLQPTPRLVLLVLAAAVLAMFLAFRVAGILSFDLAKTAHLLDRLSGEPRSRARTAWELTGGNGVAETDAMTAYHVRGAVECADRQLAGMDTHRLATVAAGSARGRQQWLALAGLAVILVLPATRTHLVRAVAPLLDTPPYSSLAFTVTPSPVKVVYGDGVQLRVAVSGGTPREDVQLVTWDAAGSHGTTCFLEGGGVYSQKLENVTSPLRFCFRTGRARSLWHEVELLLRPRILGARVNLAPPRYSGLPTHEFEVGDKPVSGLAGSTVTLIVESNRPLGGGEAVFYATTGEQLETAAASVLDPTTLRFQWTLAEPREVRAELIGSDGLEGTHPLVLRQTVVPDAPPAAEIAALPPFSLATPDAFVDVGVRAEDDLGLTSVDLVRTVAGFRDRAVSMGLRPPSPVHNETRALDLGELGVVPGETLEFFAEARDTNPSLAGISTSPVSRLTVISREEYAELLRRRTTMDEFETRFRVALEAMLDLRRKLRHLRDTVNAENHSIKELDSLRKAAAEQAGKTAELLDKLAGDFPIFQLERRFGAELANMAGDLRVAAHFLNRFTADDPKFPETLKFVLEEKVGLHAERAAEMAADAEIAALVGRMLRQAAVFNTLVANQMWTTRSILRATTGRIPDLPLLRNQGLDQRQIANDLEAWSRDIRNLADNMPTELAELAAGANTFLDALDKLEILPLMRQCADAAEAGRSAEASEKAREVLERLMRLRKECLGKGNCVARMMGGQLGFKIPQAIGPTVQQMLDCLKEGDGQRPGSSGTGLGGGPGNPNDGFSVADATGRNIPMYGPIRTRFKAGAAPAEGPGRQGGNGGGAGDEEGTDETGREVMDGQSTTSEGAGMNPFRRVHPRYREALRRYFGD